MKDDLDMTDMFMVNNLIKANRLDVVEGKIEYQEEVVEEVKPESGDITEDESGENTESGEVAA